MKTVTKKPNRRFSSPTASPARSHGAAGVPESGSLTAASRGAALSGANPEKSSLKPEPTGSLSAPPRNGFVDPDPETPAPYAIPGIPDHSASIPRCSANRARGLDSHIPAVCGSPAVHGCLRCRAQITAPGAGQALALSLPRVLLESVSPLRSVLPRETRTAAPHHTAGGHQRAHASGPRVRCGAQTRDCRVWDHQLQRGHCVRFMKDTQGRVLSVLRTRSQ